MAGLKKWGIITIAVLGVSALGGFLPAWAASSGQGDSLLELKALEETAPIDEDLKPLPKREIRKRDLDRTLNSLLKKEKRFARRIKRTPKP